MDNIGKTIVETSTGRTGKIYQYHGYRGLHTGFIFNDDTEEEMIWLGDTSLRDEFKIE